MFAQVTKISSDEAAAIELATRGQQATKRWKTERLKRITASNFATICKATERRDMAAFADKLVTPQKELRVPAILHGRTYEPVAVERYEEVMGVQTSECGLSVSTTHPMLAASPDRVVDVHTLLEVKCPYASRDRTITSTTVPYLKLVDGSLQLDTAHSYHYQIQGQLFCAGMTDCDLVIYTGSDMKILHITRDEHFIDGMLNQLLSFYNFYRSALLDTNLFHNYYRYKF